jgi:hypothetical protein
MDTTFARLLVEDRIREANHQRLVHRVQRREQPSAAEATATETRRHRRRWSLVHLHRAYG